MKRGQQPFATRQQKLDWLRQQPHDASPRELAISARAAGLWSEKSEIAYIAVAIASMLRKLRPYKDGPS